MLNEPTVAEDKVTLPSVPIIALPDPEPAGAPARESVWVVTYRLHGTEIENVYGSTSAYPQAKTRAETFLSQFGKKSASVAVRDQATLDERALPIWVIDYQVKRTTNGVDDTTVKTYMAGRDAPQRYTYAQAAVVITDIINGRTGGYNLDPASCTIRKYTDPPTPYQKSGNRVVISGKLYSTLQEWASDFGCKVSSAIIKGQTHDGEVDYVSLRDDGVVSYLPAGRPLQKTKKGNWAKEGRQETTPGRIARRILAPEVLKGLTDKDIEAFANHIKAAGSRDDVIVVRGPAIKDWYSGTKSASGGPNSCMSSGDGQSRMGLYTKNENEVGLVLLLDPQRRVRNRALLWSLHDGRLFMDRVYGSDVGARILRKYALANHWCHFAEYGAKFESRKSSEYGIGIINEVGKAVYEDLCVPLSVPLKETHNMPYLDTLRYSYAKGNCLHSGGYSTDSYATSGRKTPPERTAYPKVLGVPDMPKVVCGACGGEFVAVLTTTKDGVIRCGACHEKVYANCVNCRTELPKTQMVEGPTVGGKHSLYCELCRDRYCEKCSVCDEYNIRTTSPYYWKPIPGGGLGCIACHRAGRLATIRHCNACGHNKPLDQFNKRLSRYCSQCIDERKEERRNVTRAKAQKAKEAR